MNKPRWTSEEISILKSNVEKHFNNLHTAFVITANQTGRIVNSVCQYWYRNKDINKRLAVTFFACTNKKVIANKKVSTASKGLKTSYIPIPLVALIKNRIKAFLGFIR